MRLLKVAVLITLFIALCSFTLLGKHQAQKKKLFVDYSQSTVSEATMRRDAITFPMPNYPEDATKAGTQGWVDLAVLFDENGNFKRLKVLESPGPAISQAVLEALKQWTVKVGYDSPYRETRLPVRTFGELRFHFVIRDGIGTVENPAPEEQGITSAKFNKVNGPADVKRKVSICQVPIKASTSPRTTSLRFSQLGQREYPCPLSSGNHTAISGVEVTHPGLFLSGMT